MSTHLALLAADATLAPVAAGRSEPITLSVVIPALNEEDGIADIIRRIETAKPSLQTVGVDAMEIIVVDDGSADRTAEIAGGLGGVRLVRHLANRGYGAAIKTGFDHARGELLAFLDADGTYPPERLGALCRAAIEENADVVVGSRRSGAASQMPRIRRLGNFVFSTLVSLIGNQHVADPASGMRVLRQSALARLYPLPDGLNFTPVMSTRAVHEGLRVIELPIPYRERLGRSKLSVLHDGTRFLTTILLTSLEYNPVRLLGLVGSMTIALAVAIGLGVVVLRLQGVTTLGPWGVFGVFSALVLSVVGVSVFALGAAFNYLVSLFHRRPVRQGLFGRPLFDPPLERQFGWLGLVASLAGVGLAATSLMLGVWGWDITRLWLWLVVSALLVLVGLQLIGWWVLLHVLDQLSKRYVSAGPLVAGEHV
jgi:glycosyltransferase involved in cell wall biosynthesis